MVSDSFKKYIIAKRQKSFDEAQEMIKRILEPKKWGFRESYREVIYEYPFQVNYDSQWCRISFVRTSSGRWKKGISLSVHYGRLHVPNNLPTLLEWRKSECRPWFSEWYILLPFLEGVSPEKAGKEHWKPDFIYPYIENVPKTEDGNAERRLKRERAVWDCYGTDLFEVFDVRQPELWERFKKYIQAYYDAQGWKQPPREKYPLPPPWELC